MTHRTDGAYDLADGTKTCFAANGTYSTYLSSSRARRAVQMIIDDAVFSVICLWPHDTPGRHVTLVSYDTLGCHGTPPPPPVDPGATEGGKGREAGGAHPRPRP